jgi:hypothetical protein
MMAEYEFGDYRMRDIRLTALFLQSNIVEAVLWSGHVLLGMNWGLL